jgi:hypothetical protein
MLHQESSNVNTDVLWGSVSAFGALLLLRDPRLGAISVRGYAVVDTNAPRRTRSSSSSSALKYSAESCYRRRNLTACIDILFCRFLAKY